MFLKYDRSFDYIQQNQYIVDISGWDIDVEGGGFAYPVGARPKSLVFCPEIGPYPFLRSEHRYLFKKSFERYPSQFWAEIVAYRISKHMNIPVPPAFVAINAKEECGALVEWFYGGDACNFVGYLDGGMFISNMGIWPDFDYEKGTTHNLEDLLWLFSKMSRHQTIAMPNNWELTFFNILLFDTLIGNTDRHQDNWGLIICSVPGPAPEQFRVQIAPAFDNGTSLGHEVLETKFSTFNNPATLEAYIRRGKHHMKMRMNERRLSHPEFIEKLCSQKEHYKEVFNQTLSFNIKDLRDELMNLTKFKIPVPFTEKRAEFVYSLLRRRYDIISSIVRNA